MNPSSLLVLPLFLTLALVSLSAQDLKYDQPPPAVTTTTTTAAIASTRATTTISLAPSPTLATTSGASFTSTTDDALSEPPLEPLDLESGLDLAGTDASAELEPDLRLTGPLAPSGKPGGFGLLTLPARLLQLINPFSQAPINPNRLVRYEPVDARAWSTIVGWNPGRSAFADDTHHEPRLDLITISTSR